MLRLQDKVIAVLVAEGVEDLEYFVPYMRLQEEGATVLTAGLDLKPVRGKNGLSISPDAIIESGEARAINGHGNHDTVDPGAPVPSLRDAAHERHNLLHSIR